LRTVVKKVCENCGRDYGVYPPSMAKSRRFCSHRCGQAGKARPARSVPDGRTRWTRADLEAAISEEYSLNLVAARLRANPETLKRWIARWQLDTSGFGTLERKLAINTDKDSAAPCWLWTGAKSNGYPHAQSKGRNVSAIKATYEQVTKTKLPRGHKLVATCDLNHDCVNPDHREVVVDY
jgi:transposase-like protein